MAITWQDVIDVAPELAEIPASSQGAFLTTATTLVQDADVWGDLLPIGQAYMAAHLGQLWRLKGRGPISSEGVGALSRAYASLSGDRGVWDLTPAGQMFIALVLTTSASLGAVA